MDKEREKLFGEAEELLRGGFGADSEFVRADKDRKDREFERDLVAEVTDDYLTRREERRHFEAQWQLNSNFLAGNQYCTAGLNGVIRDGGKDYFWQEREVFNHIAFILEARLSKLNKVRPKLGIVPAGGGEDDIRASEVSGKILDSAYSALRISDILMKGTQWSESIGSVFYKIAWDRTAGRQVGAINGLPVFEGDVRVEICPPYEIFPDSITRQDVEECASIIHARAVSVEDIMRVWGVAVESEELDTLGLSGAGILGGLGLSSAVPAYGRSSRNDYAIVIERYSAPTMDKPEGELVIVAGGRLLHHGSLPFRVGEDGGFALPFVKQDSLSRAGCFFGSCVIERAIPIQRAYNAVKNRKHEFLNRLSMGVLAVEDGSVDTENLEAEGLSPGKILVYRQGSTPPTLIDPGTIPADFAGEEEKLLSEFAIISGVSDIMRTTSVPGSIGSGTALKMLLEQDDARLSTTAERIRSAARNIAQFVLRLYRQFASRPRLSRFMGSGGAVELIHWQGQNIAAGEVVLTTENELEGTAAERRAIVLELLSTGILQDENGRLPADLRHKVLDALGYGSWESEDSGRLHTLRAQRENGNLVTVAPAVKEIDDHRLHIAEHTRFMLSSDYERLVEKNSALDEVMTAHILEHKAKESGASAASGALALHRASSVNSADGVVSAVSDKTGAFGKTDENCVDDAAVFCLERGAPDDADTRVISPAIPKAAGAPGSGVSQKGAFAAHIAKSAPAHSVENSAIILNVIENCLPAENTANLSASRAITSENNSAAAGKNADKASKNSWDKRALGGKDAKTRTKVNKDDGINISAQEEK